MIPRMGEGNRGAVAGRPGIARHAGRLAPSAVGVLPLLDAPDQRLPFLGRPGRPAARGSRRIATDCGSSSVFVPASRARPLSRAAFAESSPVSAAAIRARVARAVMLSSESPRIGGRVSGHGDHDPSSAWSPFTVFTRSFRPSFEAASGSGSACLPARTTRPSGLSRSGVAAGLGTLGLVLPSPDSATHFVSSARTGSSTAWPRRGHDEGDDGSHVGDSGRVGLLDRTAAVGIDHVQSTRPPGLGQRSPRGSTRDRPEGGVSVWAGSRGARRPHPPPAGDGTCPTEANIPQVI